MKNFVKPGALLLLMAFLCHLAMAQTTTLRGRVLDSKGAPLPGVSIRLKSSQTGVSTGNDGSFSITYPANSSLVISAIGFKEQEIVLNGQTDINISLSTNSAQLEEVVVTALGVKREKRNLTYSTQEVKGDELVRSKEPNVVNALAGKVAGVQITSSSGTPGASSRIVIRGNTSIYGDNQALIVVDGVPINNDETGNLYSGPGTNRLADIDPATIENINVLKGAAAAALYGSAGSRGVVMITTKNGSINKKPTLSFSSDLSFEKALYPEVQTKYGQGERGVYFNGEDRKTSAVWGPLMDTLRINGQKAPVYDQMDLFFQTGITSNNSVSVNGGSTNSSYFFSYSYFDQKGTIPQNDYKRHSIFTKFTNRITDKLTSTFQVTYSGSKSNRAPEGYVLESPVWTIYTAPISWNPLPYTNADGTQRVFRFSRNNPYWVLDNIRNKSTVNRIIPVITFSYNPTNWLTITERLGADIYAEQDKYVEAPSNVLATRGRIIDQNINFRQFNNDIIINAHKDFGKFSTNLLLGNNIISTYSQNHYANGLGTSINGLENINNASTITYSEGNYLRRKVGFYAQANIDYNRFLNLSLTGRYDGSSVLAASNRFYPYGSAAASFVFSEFMSERMRNWVDLAKVRVSYATVGNEQIGPYQLLTPYNSASIGTNVFPLQGQSGFLIDGNLGNPNLKNETIRELELGFEGRFFKNRLGVEVSYFKKKTFDGIIPTVAIAPSTGYASTSINSSQMENKGLEVLINATPVRTSKFSWDLAFNFTRIRNKVLFIADGTERLGNGFTQVVVGQPYGVKFGGAYARTDDGQLLIDDAGLPFRTVNDQIIGNITPDWLAGLSNNFRYGQFSFSFFFDMKKGGDIENNVDGYGYFYGTPKVTENRQDRIIAGVKASDGKANDISVQAQDYYRRINGITEAVIQDGTYIKLRNISLSYDISPKLLAKTFVKGASFTLTGRNLWIHSPHFTGADPEVSSFGSSNGSQGIYSFSTPTSRSVAVSLKLSF
ncbi:SusC/RagA family TonB-linked outer membrane protein [Flavihumibacter sp. CACIAM 22H1]|uniref:SusC/RagA family TonB-linked outer membrane protein n=1 Tax=Flavihumibacter sp. CACIAM 22H1 TaxID=1812911 RepID=UPI0007A88AAA|nr:SusC/RagA family TonB-linked outer membrane protein [Flavihumibacter sp. CACIAM 22H1]KYP16387.1 MAG: SusC/RagA family TonB-linked outer membrane protein [Flavihumibacter sp. CACIAM 22H1]